MFRTASAIELNCTHSNDICLPYHIKKTVQVNDHGVAKALSTPASGTGYTFKHSNRWIQGIRIPAHTSNTLTHMEAHTRTHNTDCGDQCVQFICDLTNTPNRIVFTLCTKCAESKGKHRTERVYEKKIHISFTIFSVIVVESTVYGAILQNAHTRIDPKWYVFTLARDMPMYALFYTQRHYTTVLGELRSLYRNGKELNRAEAMYYL